ncbi:S1 RNA-binding domain-containing protein [Actinomadura sp. KC06]|uniref:S1 RNA-binding domain-containing protein n=1 Tax=Actinomadura sp. KC06 TaxID=2530369 RepID=UPI00104CE82A|nr:S1 RNA-binding domain-containing protein [Actinomadura sp. KC06]TDD27105.1 S1 RNA-binding domain-containing protein [Actinomadura sp. KC06]
MDRPDFLKTVEVGTTVTGVVTSIETFGAFVGLGPVEGLITAPNLSWRHFEDPSEVLSVGQEVTVKVLDVDHDRGRISLSLKELQPDPMTEVHQKIGSVVTGRVSGVAPIGVFVRLDDGEGLLPQPETSPDHRPKIGEEIRVRIADVDLDRRRITLSLPE